MTASTVQEHGREEPVTVTAGRTGDTLAITLAGDLDAATASTVAAGLNKHLSTNDADHVLLDLAGLKFCDTAGLRALITAYRHAIACGATCNVRNQQPHVNWLLQTTGTADALGL